MPGINDPSNPGEARREAMRERGEAPGGALHYLKAIVALAVPLIGMLLTWWATGTYNEAELIQLVTAFASGLLVLLTKNAPKDEKQDETLRA